MCRRAEVQADAQIIDKKTFFQGRTVPRGNHFYCVRIYDDSMSPFVRPANARPRLTSVP